MPGADRFSVHNTRIRRRTVDGAPFVEKTIRPNAPLPLSPAELMREMNAYCAALSAAGVPMPAVADRWEDGAGIPKLHFDTRQYYHIAWKGPEDLQEELTKRILAIVGEGPHIANKSP